MRATFGVATVLVALAVVLSIPVRTVRAGAVVTALGVLLGSASGLGGAAAAEPVPLTDRSAPVLQQGAAGVWGGQSLAVDLRRRGASIGPLLSVDLAERMQGPTWQGTVRVGGGVGITLRSTDLSATLGYGLVGMSGQDTPWQVENRLWQSLQADVRVGAANPARLSGRLRLEERDLPGAGGFQTRLRVLARGLVPFGASGWGVSGWGEVFLRLNGVGGPPGFDQHRAFIGPYVQSSRGVRAEVGYLHVWVDKLAEAAGRHTLTANHVVLLQLSVGVKASERDRSL